MALFATGPVSALGNDHDDRSPTGAGLSDDTDSRGDAETDAGSQDQNGKHGGRDNGTERDHPAAPTPPRRGKSLNARPERGHVKVRLPGSTRYVSLSDLASIPVGSIVDAHAGAVRLTSARDTAGHTDSATFGGSVFGISQSRRSGAATEIKLRGGNFTRCGASQATTAFASGLPALVTASVSHRTVRKLWSRGHGHFKTRGRNGAATVRGTTWRTVDRCDGTLVVVRHGRVDVRDFARHRTVSVPHGERYLARPAPR